MQESKILVGHLAVITGASSGIGEQYAHQLAALGADLILSARRLERLETLAQELRAKHQVEVKCVQIDLSLPGAARKLFDKSVEESKPVTILINNAGLGLYGSFMEFPWEDHQATLMVNTVTPTEATYLFLKHMLSHGKKSYISHIASIAAFQPVGNFTVYSGSKAYVRYFSETLGFELKNSNVSTTCICPGGTYTEFFEHSGQKITSTGHATMMSSKRVVELSIKAMLKGIPVYVPGVLNKLACFFPRLIPRSLGLILAFKTMSRAVERIPRLPSPAAKK